LEKLNGTENWVTEDSHGYTNLPMPATTVSSPQHTTGLWNKTTSHTLLGKQHSMSPACLVLGIIAAVLGGVMLLVLVMLLIWWKYVVTPVRGFYSVTRQTHRRLHDTL